MTLAMRARHSVWRWRTGYFERYASNMPMLWSVQTLRGCPFAMGPISSGSEEPRLTLAVRICMDQMKELFADMRGVEVGDRALTRMTRQLVT